MSAPSPESPAVRRATRDDSADLARLLLQLEHPTSAVYIDSCWEEWSAAGNAAFVAAGADGTLVGAVTTHQMRVLHRERPVGRITALVVDAVFRGQGIGRLLVAAAEAALADSGCGLIEVTSNLRRTDAHAFYERIGFVRTSLRFAKKQVPQ